MKIREHIFFLSLFFSVVILVFTVSCKKLENPSTESDSDKVARVTTTVDSISSTQARFGGIIIRVSNDIITGRGVCWGLNLNPSVYDNCIQIGSGEGTFAQYINGLIPNTKYYVRAYAKYNMGYIYGNNVEFTTEQPTQVNDIDGNVYLVVRIGEQRWLKQNLRVKRFNNGDSIPMISQQLSWNNTSSAACSNYNNDNNTGQVYGSLYNWYSVKDTRGVCPQGWHVPDEWDWTTLINYLGGVNKAGGKLKDLGNTFWQNPNTAATNYSGFSAMPSGYRDNTGFYQLGYETHYWSSEESTSTDAHIKSLYYNDSIIGEGNSPKIYGYSVRCVMD